MGIRKFYIKHQDKIELSRAFIGVILFLIFTIYFDWWYTEYTDLDGLFNNQVEAIIDVCVNGGGCP